MGLKEIVYYGVDWVILAQDSVKWRVVSELKENKRRRTEKMKVLP
jgi:hypothetical protein